MKKTIQKFVDDKKVAIVGASNNKDNFGTFLLKELKKLGYEPVPVNPECKEVEGIACVPTVKDLSGGKSRLGENRVSALIFNQNPSLKRLLSVTFVGESHIDINYDL